MECSYVDYTWVENVAAGLPTFAADGRALEDNTDADSTAAGTPVRAPVAVPASHCHMRAIHCSVIHYAKATSHHSGPLRVAHHADSEQSHSSVLLCQHLHDCSPSALNP